MALIRANTGGGGSGSGSGNLTSTVGSYYEETVGTIIVGGTSYARKRRTVYCGAMPASGSDLKNISHGISTINGVISIVGTAKNPTAKATMALPYAASTSLAGVYLRDNYTKIAILVNADLSAYSETYITIEYY